MWYGTLEYARKWKVTIIKLPAHTTDLLQPLDVSVFKSLKDTWGNILFKRLHKNRSRLTKAEFATLISSRDVWQKAFSVENITARFQKCGISPCDRSTYPEYRFNANLKKRYDTWIGNGKPELTADQLDEMFALKSYDDGSVTDKTTIENKEEVTYNGRKGKVVSFFIPDDEPDNLIRIASLTGTPTGSTPATDSTPPDPTPSGSSSQSTSGSNSPISFSTPTGF